MPETRIRSRDTVGVRLEGAVAMVQLDRPSTLNAFNIRMGRDLLGVLDEIAGEPAVGAVVLTGSDRAFSSGFDLRADDVPLTEGGRPDTAWGLREVFNPVVLALRQLPQPVIAAVNGIAAGIGCSYALACDLVVMARGASMLMAFVNVGLVPDGGSTVLLAARAGLGRALEMSLLGDRVDADTAQRWGLANAVVDDDAVVTEALQVARRIAHGPPAAHAAIKTLLNAPLIDRLRSQLELEAATQAERTAGPEALEAITAFIEKRAPRFR